MQTEGLKVQPRRRVARDAAEVEQPEEGGSGGRWPASEEDEAAGERRPVRQAEEGRDAGQARRRQGEEERRLVIHTTHHPTRHRLPCSSLLVSLLIDIQSEEN